MLLLLSSCVTAVGCDDASRGREYDDDDDDDDACVCVCGCVKKYTVSC